LSRAEMLSERGGVSVIKCEPRRSARVSTAFSRSISVELRVNEIHVMRFVGLVTAASTSERSWQTKTCGGSGSLNSPFCDPRKTNLCPVSSIVFIPVLSILGAGNRVLRILLVPGFYELFPVFLDDLHHRRVDVFDPPARRHEQLPVTEAEPPFVRLVHDRDMRRLDAFLLPNLHFPALGLELPWQWHIKRHPCPPHIMSHFSIKVNRTFTHDGHISEIYCTYWPVSASSAITPRTQYQGGAIRPHYRSRSRPQAFAGYVAELVMFAKGICMA